VLFFVGKELAMDYYELGGHWLGWQNGLMTRTDQVNPRLSVGHEFMMGTESV